MSEAVHMRPADEVLRGRVDLPPVPGAELGKQLAALRALLAPGQHIELRLPDGPEGVADAMALGGEARTWCHGEETAEGAVLYSAQVTVWACSWRDSTEQERAALAAAGAMPRSCVLIR